MDDSADPQERFDRLLTGLLAVKKAELNAIEEQIKTVQKEKLRRKRQATSRGRSGDQ
jgi:hypothetical protein